MTDAGAEQTGGTLWELRKNGHLIKCVISGEPGHEELQVLVDSEVYLQEIHTVHEGGVARAQVLHRGFEAHGWTPLAVAETRQDQ